jgi:E3 ubiquitin-protein ligase UBR4
VLDECIKYLLKYSPKITTFLNNDYDLWKEFLSYTILPYVLRILTGLCRAHGKIQEAIGSTCIPLLHKLEQFSSGSARIGVLAEDLLVMLKTNKTVASVIEEVQTQTKNEKKKLAMAMRQKQLSQLGMAANDKGQLTVIKKTTIKDLVDEESVEDEKGHTCRICREGYKYHPHKVLAIYTFSKKVDIEPFEVQKARKTPGYSTVTHFNIVHIDCHTNAIRLSRVSNRDEWENATLLNANTKCNGLLPLWGPAVPETAFSNALAR